MTSDTHDLAAIRERHEVSPNYADADADALLQDALQAMQDRGALLSMLERERERADDLQSRVADKEYLLAKVLPELSAAQSDLAAAQAKVAMLREALEPFAEYAPKEFGSRTFPDDMPVTQGSPLARKQITIGDLRRARKANEETG